MKKIVFALMGTFLLASCSQEKTAYVDNTKLIQEYQGLKDTEAKFTSKTDLIKKQLDSAAKAFQAEVKDYQSKAKSMSSSARKEKEQELMEKQQSLRQQQATIGKLLNQKSNKAIDSIVEVVKSFVADYGEKNGYTYIFGSTASANIMYAKEGKDITEEVLKVLNADYKK